MTMPLKSARKLPASGQTAEPVRANLFTSFRNDHTCNQDFYTMEQKAYAETRAIVDKYKDVIFDYEMFNEVTLRPETVMEVPFNSAGTSTMPYTNKPCYQTLKAVLRGMSNGIGYFKTRGYPVRIILGVVGRDFGFLTFMQQQRVFFDVVGFTIYPSSTQRSLLDDPWYGPGGPFAQLAKFNRPVQINETNCAEIYDTDYNNYDMNSAKVKKCFQSYKNHIPSFFNQKLVKLESLHFYELTDDPTKTGRESRFGLMYALNNQKSHLYITGAFAGGGLSSAERQHIIDLGVFNRCSDFKLPEHCLDSNCPKIVRFNFLSSLKWALNFDNQWVSH